jgi:hypothetical protein
MVMVLRTRGFETRYRGGSGPWQIIGAIRP